MDENLWQPTASRSMLEKRAAILRQIRRFFDQLSVLEVDTPCCSIYANPDPNIDSFQVQQPTESQVTSTRWLHTSPEFPMKRLLAAGYGSIYQICKVFRAGEMGRLHNPEFTLLEWYRTDFDQFQLIEEVASLVNQLSPNPREIELLPYGSLFKQQLKIDPHTASLHELRNTAIRCCIAGAEDLQLETRDGWLDLLFSYLIQPSLGQHSLCFVHDYPASQAALARINPLNPAFAERFELFYNGVELANGYHELADATEQRRRFEQQQHTRKKRGLAKVPYDDFLIQALEKGLPDCSGVALGLDRLLMVLTGAKHLSEVLAFPADRS